MPVQAPARSYPRVEKVGLGEDLIDSRRQMMQIAQEKLQQYYDKGFVLLEQIFEEAEIGRLKERLPTLLAEDNPGKVLEKDGITVRSVYGSHLTDELFGRLTCDRRMLEPAQKILNSDVYVHQFKINLKAALSGDVWEWHQDYIFWLNEDGVPSPHLATAAVFLDDVNEFNGPMVFIPGSHNLGVINVKANSGILEQYRDGPEWISNLTADIKYSIPKPMVQELVASRGMEAPKGARGSVLLFHPDVIHASSPNISPYDRALVLITYNSIHNIPIPTANRRPDFLCSRRYQALEPELR
jgi:ectoine hydroxylase